MASPPAIVARAFVTSTEWGQIADEIADEKMEVIDPTKPKTIPNPRNFRKLRIGKCLTLCNAETEDQAAVDAANQLELGESRARLFAFRRDNFISGKKSYPDPIET